MGAWSPALFDDDDAADLRSDYRAYLADAQSDAAATDLAATNYVRPSTGRATQPHFGWHLHRSNGAWAVSIRASGRSA